MSHFSRILQYGKRRLPGSLFERFARWARKRRKARNARRDDPVALIRRFWTGVYNNTQIAMQSAKGIAKAACSTAVAGADSAAGAVELAFKVLESRKRKQNMFWKNYGAETTLDGFEYLRNTQGDVTQRLNAVDAVFNEMYVNDKLDQVKSLTRGTISGDSIETPTFTENFSPDGFGNQSSYEQAVDGSTTVDQTSTFGPTNEVQDFTGDGWATPGFDAAGNATATPNPLAPTTGLNVQVDAWNHVTNVTNTTDSINVSYFYDGLGNMIVRVNTLTASDKVSTTDIYYSGQQVVEEDPRLPAMPDGTATAVAHQYVYSPRSINTPILDTQTAYTVVSSVWTSATSTYYFLTDANNNVTAVTDSSGAVQERYVYSAFGTATIYNSGYSATRSASSVNNTVLFACMSVDTATGLYKDGVRMYSALTSTFLSTDPAQSDFNTYRYSLNDPTTITDPTGLWGEGVGQSFDKPSNPCSGGIPNGASPPMKIIGTDDPPWVHRMTPKEMRELKMTLDAWNAAAPPEEKFDTSVMSAGIPVGWGEAAWYTVHIPFAKLGQAITSPLRLLGPGAAAFFQEKDALLEAEMARAGIYKYSLGDKLLNLGGGLGGGALGSYWLGTVIPGETPEIMPDPTPGPTPECAPEVPDTPGESPGISPSELTGQTRDGIRQMAVDKGLTPKGQPDPVEGLPRKWSDPVTNEPRLRLDRGHVDPGTGLPYDNPNAAVDHVHGYEPDGTPIRDPSTGDKHFPTR